MAMQRYSGYAKGSPLQQLAPLPFETRNIFGTTDYNYPFGVLAYQETDEQVVFHAGGGNWIQLGGGNSQIETINTLPPDANRNFQINAGAGITITPGTSSITLSLTGGSTAIDSIIPQSGTMSIVPTAQGAIFASGAGSIATVGGLNTLGIQLTGLTANTVLIGQGTTTIGLVGPSTDANVLIGGTPPTFGNTITGPFGATQYNISNTTFSPSSQPFIKYGEIPVSADGTYAIATGSSVEISGTFYISWLGTNRIHTVCLFCETTQFDDTISTLQVFSNNSYLQQDVLTNFRYVSQNSDQAHYLLVDVGNRNGGTNPITVVWIGNPGVSPTINPGSPTASTTLDLFGFYQNTNGNMQYNGGSLACDTFEVQSSGPTITSGSGAPSSSQPKGSFYMRTDGSTINDRAYIATDAVGGWTNLVTAT